MVDLASTPTPPAPALPCGCDQTARLVRRRPATVQTVPGTIMVRRSYYRGVARQHGTVSVDAAFGVAARSTSAGLDELLAL